MINEEEIYIETEQFDNQLEILKKRIPQNEGETKTQYENRLTFLLEDTCNLVLNKLYPFKKKLPVTIPERYCNWQIRVCVYLNSNAQFLGISKYEENGIKIEFTSDNIPQSLMNEIVPAAGSVNGL